MIAGITKVRNEQEIIADTIRHFSQWCDKIYVYDDCSEDNTVDICRQFPNVVVIEGLFWDMDRYRAEYENRQMILTEAKKDNPDWIIYFDADERIDWDFKGYEDYDAVEMKLFDFYITLEDVNKPYFQRKYCGPEYRNIVMMFKNHPALKYHIPDQRIVTLPDNAKILKSGYVKHYGKAISEDEWEKTCEYYFGYFPEPYKTKWYNRKGKAIHTLSDFGRPLITWDEKEEKGIQM